MTGVRAAFEAGRGFALDGFQSRALDAIDSGHSVLVAAPTGSGKTIVAEYAVARTMAEGGKVFYTTPIKALSNQKYGDLAEEHGRSRVGLLTGDNSINGEAPVVVMTTEVLRNMIYAASPTLAGLRYVVLDEVHYLQNPYRGAVWEEVIIHLPQEVSLICLSATVSNAEELAEWLRSVRGETTPIIEERRPVELEHLYAVGDREAERIHVLPTFVGSPEPIPNPEAARLGPSEGARGRGMRRDPRARGRGRLFTPPRSELVERLRDDAMLPAIFFIFSRAGCDDAVRQCLRAGVRLTDEPERVELARIAQSRTSSLSSGDLDALGYAEWLAGLDSGFAAHHAGMVPPMKEAVEEAFSAGLLKAVFATETLALGINMPARSVVIEKLSKFTGERHEFLTPGEYTQLTGRAGRRGIDTRGYAVVCWSPFVAFEQVATLASRRTYALTSSFSPTYNTGVNLVRRYERDEAHHLLSLSLAQYQADRGVVAAERRLRSDRKELRRLRDSVALPEGRLAEYRRLSGELKAARSTARSAPGARKDPLRRGDVIPSATIRGSGSEARVADLEKALAAHPLADDPRLDQALRAVSAAERLERDVARRERRAASRSDTLVRRLDRVLGLLESWGYLDGWRLTPAGEILARIYSEADLLVSESVREGVLDGLPPADLAALVSCFTYERRGPEGDEPQPPRRWPSGRVRSRARALDRIWHDLNLAERDAHLPETRPPDPGFAAALHDWVAGEDLAEVIEEEEMTGGDFVRNTKQCIDLLRQIGDVAPDPQTAAAARAAADAAFRGVIAASSLVRSDAAP